MTVTPKGRVLFVVNGDAVNWATMVGTGPAGIYRARVNALMVRNTGTATAGVTTFATAGSAFWSTIPATDGTSVLAFSEPQEFDDLSVAAQGTNTVLSILLA